MKHVPPLTVAIRVSFIAALEGGAAIELEVAHHFPSSLYSKEKHAQAQNQNGPKKS